MNTPEDRRKPSLTRINIPVGKEVHNVPRAVGFLSKVAGPKGRLGDAGTAWHLPGHSTQKDMG